MSILNNRQLSFEQLVDLFEDWLISKEEVSSLNLDTMLTVKFRNIVFKQVLLEEK